MMLWRDVRSCSKSITVHSSLTLRENQNKTGTKVAIPDIPGAPFSIATTPTCIVLRWTEPSGNGLPVDDYLIHWSREGVGRVWTGWRRFRIVPEAHVRIESLASDRG